MPHKATGRADGSTAQGGWLPAAESHVVEWEACRCAAWTLAERRAIGGHAQVPPCTSALVGREDRQGRLIPSSNVQLDVPKRVFVINENKATGLADKLGKVSDPYVRVSLELQRTFGLRREESIKFQPRYADHGDHLKIKGSWTKGGRERVIPITTPEQRATLDRAHRLVGERSMIPAEKTYIEQRHVYDRQCSSRVEAHAWIAARVCANALRSPDELETTGGGGPSTQSSTASQRLADFERAKQLAGSLVTSGVEITKVYRIGDIEFHALVSSVLDADQQRLDALKAPDFSVGRRFLAGVHRAPSLATNAGQQPAARKGAETEISAA